jgi:N-formylglutamate deformylase
MTDVYSFSEGPTPLLISIPHDGRLLAPGQAERMTDVAKALPDTDWFVRDLYEFSTAIGANVVAANYSRYVVDLNRSADDAAPYANQISTGLCPTQTFAGEKLYLPGESVSALEQAIRVREYWQPYHDKISDTLDQLTQNHGHALLWDAHSIASEVPSLFPGVLTDINIGTNGSKSCAAACEQAVMVATDNTAYSAVLNGRFQGGYITRHYGKPDKNNHAIQLELSQRCYMDEKRMRYDENSANDVAETIKRMLQAFVASGQKLV